jgi:hypothetical protein
MLLGDRCGRFEIKENKWMFDARMREHGDFEDRRKK